MTDTLKRRIFDEKALNQGRQHEFDLARAFVIYFLPYIHITIACSTEEALCGGIPYLFDTVIGGSFSAPMYMFVMGFGMIYARGYTLRDFFRRGLSLLALSYVLNICRYLIPSMIGYAITGHQERFLEPLLYKVLGNDILTFAGIAMIVIAVLVELKIPKWGLAAIALASSALGTLLNGIDVNNPLGNIFLGYLIGTEDQAGLVLSDFPLLNWLIFPLMGYLFADILIKVKDKKRFYLLFSPACVLFTAAYYIYGISNELGMFGEGQNCYYHMVFPDAVASLTLTLGLLGVYYFLSLVLPEWFLKLAEGISRDITEVYFIHWVFVSVVADLVLYTAMGIAFLNSPQILAVSTAISIVSIVLAHYYNRFRKRGFAGNEK